MGHEQKDFKMSQACGFLLEREGGIVFRKWKILECAAVILAVLCFMVCFCFQ